MLPSVHPWAGAVRRSGGRPGRSYVAMGWQSPPRSAAETKSHCWHSRDSVSVKLPRGCSFVKIHAFTLFFFLFITAVLSLKQGLNILHRHVGWKAVQFDHSQEKDVCREGLTGATPAALLPKWVLRKPQSFHKCGGAVRRFPFALGGSSYTHLRKAPRPALR